MTFLSITIIARECLPEGNVRSVTAARGRRSHQAGLDETSAWIDTVTAS
jgi:hypothetical protein